MGERSEHVYYMPGFCHQLLKMFEKGQVEMFNHKHWNESAAIRKAFRVNIGSNKTALIPTRDFSFELICDCRQPKSDMPKPDMVSLQCSGCRAWFHQTCYLIGDKKLAVKMVFICYSCRLSEDYTFMFSDISTDDTAISEVAARINVASPSKLFSHLPEVRNRNKRVPETMDDYKKLENVISKFDLTTTANGRGDIFVALQNFALRSMPGLPGNQKFSDLNKAEITHLSVLMIADVLKLDVGPLYRPQLLAFRIGISDRECLKSDRDELQKIDLEFLALNRKLNKLSKLKKNYTSCRDDISELQNGYAEVRQKTNAVVEDLATIKVAKDSALNKAKLSLIKKCESIVNSAHENGNELKRIIDNLKIA